MGLNHGLMGLNHGLMGLNHGLMGLNHGLIGFNGIYPLVNIEKTIEHGHRNSGFNHE